MRQIFSEHGVPAFVRSDNGPHYSGNDFREFARIYKFQHITSSPHYPRSNGFIESQVKIIKRTLAKARISGTDPNKALFSLRATPVDHNLPSPGEFLGRQLQDGLPRKLPRQPYHENIREQMHKRQEQQKLYHDKNAHLLPPLSAGEQVTVQNPTTKKWEPSIVMSQASSPRSYQVTTAAGNEVCRNRRHIRPAPQPSEAENSQSLSDDSAANATEGDRPTSTTMLSPQVVELPSEGSESGIHTRSGRTSKAPQRLDL
ncbi:Pol polyprotein [Elysia marginata]|uniref:Pol polyprotein n=1 Tax=Elysia marginata TaxID=1093978 RepID=A0AAV4EWJ9_9GAST|nr:Pol polyprotein [Elysia marginata]